MAADLRPIPEVIGGPPDDPVFLDAVAELIARGMISQDEQGRLGLTEIGEAALDGRVDFLPIEVKNGR